MMEWINFSIHHEESDFAKLTGRALVIHKLGQIIEPVGQGGKIKPRQIFSIINLGQTRTTVRPEGLHEHSQLNLSRLQNGFQGKPVGEIGLDGFRSDRFVRTVGQCGKVVARGFQHRHG